MDSLKLFPMGKVYHIQDYKSNPIKKRVGSFDFVFREISEKDYFNEIIFSTQMVKHHFSESYEECLLPKKALYHTCPPETLTKNN